MTDAVFEARDLTDAELEDVTGGKALVPYIVPIIPIIFSRRRGTATRSDAVAK